MEIISEMFLKKALLLGGEATAPCLFKQFLVLVKKSEIWKKFFESQTSDFQVLLITLFLQKNSDFSIFFIFGQNRVCSCISFVG